MEIILIFSFANCALIECFRKWKIIEKYDFNRKIWMPEFCEFCIFFWIGLIESISMPQRGVLCVHTFLHVCLIGLAIQFVSHVFNVIYNKIKLT